MGNFLKQEDALEKLFDLYERPMYYYVFPKNSTSLDYVLTTASLVNSSGSKVKTWTNIKSTMNGNGYFIFDNSYTVQRRGQYKLTYSVKCYKNGTVIDTANSETAYQAY